MKALPKCLNIPSLLFLSASNSFESSSAYQSEGGVPVVRRCDRVRRRELYSLLGAFVASASLAVPTGRCGESVTECVKPTKQPSPSCAINKRAET